MSSQSVEQLSFDFLPHLPIVVQQHEGQLSSDAGLLPLRQFDQRWNYTARMAECLHDPKGARAHSLESMLRQRLFGILAGYEDCNDHDGTRRFIGGTPAAERSGLQADRGQASRRRSAGQPAHPQPLREPGDAGDAAEADRLHHRHRHRALEAEARRRRAKP